MNTTALSKFLKEHCLPHNEVDIQPGLLTDYGFDPRLSEIEYYGLYAFFFYRNEWVERIFDHYQLVDKDYGAELIRINEDGFRLRLTKQNLAVGSLKFNGKLSTDFFVRVCRKLPTDPKLLKNAYLRADFYDDSIQKFAVDEIVLKFTDTFSIIFNKRTNLKTLKEIFDVRIQLHVTPTTSCAHYQTHVISAHTLKQLLHEIELLLKTVRQDAHPDTATYKSICKDAYHKNERDEPYTLTFRSDLA